MGSYSGEDIERYKAFITAKERYSRMQTRLIKEQAIMIELLEERNAALEDRLCELIIEKNMLKEKHVIRQMDFACMYNYDSRVSQRDAGQRRGGSDEKSHYIRNV